MQSSNIYTFLHCTVQQPLAITVNIHVAVVTWEGLEPACVHNWIAGRLQTHIVGGGADVTTNSYRAVLCIIHTTHTTLTLLL